MMKRVQLAIPSSGAKAGVGHSEKYERAGSLELESQGSASSVSGALC
jgi:hypothetical protein